jgi:hypothetical protein
MSGSSWAEMLSYPHFSGHISRLSWFCSNAMLLAGLGLLGFAAHRRR